MREAILTTVLGQRGSGKSSWIKRLLPEIPRFILWDTLGEYEGFKTFEDTEDLFEYVYSKRKGLFQAVVNCVEENEGGEVEAFDFVCKLAGSVENVCLIVEEVDTYATPNVIPFELKRLLKVGRHFGVSMLFVSRRPAEIHRLITSQSQRFICFRMIEPNDVRYMTSIIGEAARELPDLPMLHFIDWQHGQIEKGVITFGRENSKAHQAAIEESDQSRAGKNHESSLSRKSENGVGGSMEQVKEKA